MVKTKYGLTEKQLERILVAKKSRKIVPLKIKIGQTYKFAAIGDTHLCSHQEKLEALYGFYNICKKEGIKDVYHAGDILEGQSTYYGQEYEIHTFGADNQVRYCVENYPKVKGITTHFITGNHDYAFYKKLGVDVGKHIAAQRDDMNYLGAFEADIFWKKIRLIRLVHPDGGMPYALSYRLQRYVEQIASGSKPKIILAGHLHTQYQMDYRNIFIFGVGCFQGQTPFILRKGINPTIGGWIITIKVLDDKSKSIIEIIPRFIKFY